MEPGVVDRRGAGPPQAPGLLERDAHLAAMDGLITRIGTGGARCVLLKGPAGIGKTSILDVAETAARSAGIKVRRAIGDDLEARLPWGLVRRLFGDVEPDELSGTPALAQPVFAPAHGAPSATDDASPDAFPLLHGLLALTQKLAAAEPQLLVLDDLQWGDAQSLRFFTYLLNRADRVPVGVLLASRGSGHLDPATHDLEARIASAPPTTVLPIEALGATSVADLVRSALPGATDEFCAAIHHSTGGNPFLCHELLVAARTEAIAPDDDGARRLAALDHAGVRTSIMVRLGRLGRAAREVAGALAVLSASAAIPRVTELADLDSDSAAEAIDRLVAEAMLEIGPGGLRFVHPIIRETVYGDLGPGRRTSSHRQAALLLHRDGAEPGEVASHVLAGELREAWAVPTLRAAARAALRQGAPERAQSLLEAALSASDEDDDAQPRLLVELAHAEATGGGSTWARSRLHSVLDSLSRGEADAMIARDIGEALYATGYLPEASAAFERGLGLLAASATERRGSIVEAQLVAGLDMAGTLQGARPARVEQILTTTAATAADRSLADRVVLCLVAGRHAYGVGVPPEERRRATAAELAHAALEGDPLPLDLGTIVLEPLALSLLFAEEFEDARALLDRLIHTAATRGELPALASLSTLRGLVNLAAGDLAAAVTDGTEAIALATESPAVHSQTDPARHVVANASLLLGNRSRATEVLTVSDPGDRWGGSLLHGWFLEATGRLALDRGDPAGARDAFAEAGRRFLEGGGPAAFCPWRSGAALAHQRLGELDQAQALADEELRLAEEFGAPRAITEAHRVRAGLEPDAAAAERLAATLELVTGGPALTQAGTLVDLGSTLRRLGHRNNGREHLRRGLALARTAGAVPLAERAEAELLIAGARRPTAAVTGPGALTPSERRVADLAVDGLTNPEIAATLHVTRKTVEVHLSAAYRKLGIRSRSELADRLR